MNTKITQKSLTNVFNISVLIFVFLAFSPIRTFSQNYALNFDGSGEYLEGSGVVLANKSFTIEAWFNATNTNAVQSLFTQGEQLNNKGLHLHLYRQGGVYVGFYGNDVAFPWVATSGWHHIAVVHDKAQTTVYMDGVSIGTKAHSGFAGLNPQFAIGRDIWQFYGPFSGDIDEFKIWEEARTQSEVQTDMTTAALGNEANLLLSYRFNDGPSSSIVTNLTGNTSLNATLTNMDPQTDWVSGYPVLETTEPITDTNIQIAVNDWVANPTTAETTYGHIKDWDVSAVTNMSSLFISKTTFNEDITSWDVSNVTNMAYMFNSANEFNQPIGDWDVSSVTDMQFMFWGASNFNQPIGNWDVSKVTNMNAMFYGSEDFNLPIGIWDVSSVTNMGFMFSNAVKFNQPIGNWDVSSVTTMQFMFEAASKFNQPIGDWDVSSVSDMTNMFHFAEDFNQDLTGWCVTNINSIPDNFATNANNFDTNNFPVWGTCNTTPTDITLSASAIDENAATATTVGAFSTTDSDSADTHTYSLVAGTGDTNNGSFTITGADLNTNATIDYETNPTLSIRVQTNDGTDTIEKVITITVNDLDEIAPVIALNTPTIQTIEVGTAYSELGATATDNLDAANTLTVIPTVNNENTAVVGSFTVDYNVSDAAGNAATEVIRTVNVVDTTAPTVVTKDITVQLDANGEALITATQINNGSSDNYTSTDNLSLSINKSTFSCENLGANTVILTVTDEANNSSTAAATVTVEDNTAPTIALSGDASVTHEALTAYTDLGATAADNCSATLAVTDNINVNTLGFYTVTYTATDSSGNVTTATRTVNVVDTTKPVITLIGDNPQIVTLNTAYEELGATAADNYNGDISTSIGINTLAIDLATVNCYPVTYNVSDASENNAVQLTRIVFVLEYGKPLAKSDTKTVAQDSKDNLFTIIGNDSYGLDGAHADHPIALSGTYTDNGGKLDLVGDEVKYTPRAGFFGVDKFSYTITDENGDASPAEVTITVTEGSVANNLTAVADEKTVIRGGTTTIVVLSNDLLGTATAADLDAITISNNINGAVITVNPDNSIEYESVSTFSGSEDTFEYTIKETGTDNLSTAIVRVIIEDSVVTDSVLSAKNDEVSVAQNSTDNEIAVLLDNGFDIDSFGLDGAIDNGLTFLDGTLTGLSEQGTIIVETNSSDSPLDDVIVYTPNTGFVGVDHFYYMITDTTGASSIAQVAITVTEIDTPTAQDDEVSVLQDSGVTSIAVLSNDSFGSDGRNDTKFLEIDLSYSSANLAAGIVVNGDNVDYTAADGFTGQETFRYTIYDFDGQSKSAIVTITVGALSTNDSPTAQDDAVIFAQDSSENIINILDDNGSGADNYGLGAAHPSNPISLVAFYSEKGGSLELDGTTVKYTPRTGYVGEDTFDYLITDENGVSDRATVTINVTEINTPTAQNDAATVAQGVTIPIDVLSNDSFGLDGQATNDALTIDVATNVNGATIAVNAGKIDYTPASNYIGIDIFTYIITDGSGDTTTADVTITVTGTAVVDEPNVLSAKRDEVSVAQNSTDNEIAVLLDNGFDIDSFGLDGAIDNGLTFLDGTLTGLSEQGTIIVETNSSDSPLDDVIVYTPNTGFVGVDHFYYMITDTTGASSIAQVAITVTEIDTPTAANDTIEILGGSSAAVTIDVLDNDSFGSNGAALSDSLEIISSGTVTAVVVDGTSIEYTPTGNETGTDTFTYRIKDAVGVTSDATVTVTFTTVIASDAPTAQDDAVIFAQDSSENIINILDDNGSGADNYGSGAAHPSHPISLVAFYSEKGGSLELDGTTVKYTPRTGYVGEDTFDYLITDENGVSDRATVTINVTGSVANGLTAVADEKAAVEGVTRTINVLANDVFGTAFLETVVISNESNEVTITVNSDNTLEYTYTVAPGATFTGATDTFNYTIKEAGTTNESTATVTVTIQAADAVNGVPEAKGDTFSVVQGIMSSLAVLADNGSGVDNFGSDGENTTNPLRLFNGTTEGKSVKQIEREAQGSSAFNNLVVNSGKIEYTPVSAFIGEDSFYYKIVDASGDESIAQVTINVTSSKSSGIVTTDAVIKDLQVYPNPSKGAFKVLVYSEKAEQASVLLFDVTGKVVYNKKQLLSAGNNTMNLHVNVQTGILFLKVYTDNTNFGTKKILFE